MRSYSTLSVNSQFIMSLISGVFVTVTLSVILMCILSVVFMTCSLLPYEYLNYIMMGIISISVFVGGYVSARINKSRGLLIGSATGALIVLSMLICGFCMSSDNITVNTLIRIIAIMLCSAVGGIKGVNVKEKIRIR